MTDEIANLSRVARQLLAIEQVFGADFLPTADNPLPEVKRPRAASQNVPAKRAATTAAATPAPAIQAFTPGEAPAAGPYAILSREEKAKLLGRLADEHCNKCEKCSLCQGRANVVFGEGDPAAELVFVGEGPGADEDRLGRPFVGRAGELLTKMITAMGLSREQVYIANMVKCRPPSNRTPVAEEIAACWPYLVKQLEIIHPKVIITLGNPATQNLLKTKIGITKLRGQWQPLPAIGEGLEGTSVMPTFHPAYLLRNYTPETRGRVWSDLQTVMTHLANRHI